MIFIPGGRQSAPEKQLIAVGLTDHIAGHEVAEVPGPPDGGPGALFFWRRPGEGGLRIAYEPEQQEWIPAATQSETIPAGRFYVGTYTDQPPTKADLRRPMQVKGHRIALNDGVEWLLPSPAELPVDLVLGDDGRWQNEPKRMFQRFNLDAAEWLKFFALIPPDGAVEIDFQAAVNFVVSALRINYRITPEIVSALKLLSSDMVTPAIYAACGLLASAGQKTEA